MEAFLIIALIIAAIVGVAVWRGRQFGDLARRGIPVTGQVVRKFRTGSGKAGSRNRRIAFTYRGPDGAEYRRAASLTDSKWSEFEEGSPIALVCLPDKPGVSAPAWLVEHAREALQRKSRG
jgi:hypothetical protein